MKKNLLLSTLFVMLVSLVSAGEINKAVDPFTTVVVTGNYKVTMIESTEEKVVIINNDENITDEKILISVEGGTLDIKIKGDTYLKARMMDVTIYYKKVNQIDARRGAQVTVNNLIKSDVVTFNCSTGGQVKAQIEAGTAKLKISNDGLINVTGTATIAEMEVSTGGTLVANLLTTESASAKISGGGSIKVFASKKVTATVFSGGTITYYGNPAAVEESIKVAGTIEKAK
jgi:hypothetical protein